MSGRNRSLDGVRGLAALAVLFFHSHVPGFSRGALGVQTFFVLSGFLITGLLAQEVRATGGVAFGRFVARRARRLMPALLVVVVLTTALTPLLLPRFVPLNLISGLLAATYTMNIGHALGLPFTPLGHTWTLALEAQFYLLWPLIALPLVRLRRPVLALLCAWSIVLGLRLTFGPTLSEFGQSQLTCVECLLLGATAAMAPPPPAALGWVGAVGLIVATFAPAIASGISPLPLPELASALLVAGLQRPSALSRGLSWPPLVGLGLISYGVYLWHAPLTRVFNPYGWQVSGPATLALAIGLATISYLTIEAWFRRRGPLHLQRQGEGVSLVALGEAEKALVDGRHGPLEALHEVNPD